MIELNYHRDRNYLSQSYILRSDHFVFNLDRGRPGSLSVWAPYCWSRREIPETTVSAPPATCVTLPGRWECTKTPILQYARPEIFGWVIGRFRDVQDHR